MFFSTAHLIFILSRPFSSCNEGKTNFWHFIPYDVSYKNKKYCFEHVWFAI